MLDNLRAYARERNRCAFCTCALNDLHFSFCSRKDDLQALERNRLELAEMRAQYMPGDRSFATQSVLQPIEGLRCESCLVAIESGVGSLCFPCMEKRERAEKNLDSRNPHTLVEDLERAQLRAGDSGDRPPTYRRWRHLAAWAAGEERDPESGLSHLGHALCNAVFLRELERSSE